MATKLTAETDRLAIDGGTPVRSEPLPPSHPGGMSIGEEEKRAVLEVLDSKWLLRYPDMTTTYMTERFEKLFAERMGLRYAHTVPTGTAALHTAAAAIGLGPGDEFLVPAYTWISTADAPLALGAIPVIVEIDETLNMDPADIEGKITERTRAIFPVHMRGAAADMDPILRIAREPLRPPAEPEAGVPAAAEPQPQGRGLLVVEDCAQDVGGHYKGRPVGSLGDIGCYSLQFHKVITTGEGGVVGTNDDELWDAMCRFADHGAGRTALPNEPEKYVLGLKYQVSEVMGAIALEQCKKLDRILQQLQSNHRRVIEGIADIEGIRLRPVPDGAEDIGVCVVFYVDGYELASRFIQALRAENIGCFNLWDSGYHVYKKWTQIIHRRTLSREGWPFSHPKNAFFTGGEGWDCPRSDRILQDSVHIDTANPHYTEQDVQDIITAVRKVARALL